MPQAPFPPLPVPSLRQRPNTTPSATPPLTPASEHAPLLAAKQQSSADGSGPSKSHPLLEFQELPGWMSEFESEYTLVGYRREQNSYKGCWWSVIGYLHNETVNIHTHLLAAFVPLALLLLHHFPYNPYPASLRWQDTFHFSVFLASAIVCLTFSGTYHTLSCHSKTVANRWNQMDYVGIVILIVGSNYPAIYYGFYCDLHLQWIYTSIITVLGSIATYMVLHPLYTTGPYRWARTLIFLSLGCSAIVPVTHNLLAYGSKRARDEMGLAWLLASGGLYIAGALVYALRFPERKWPRTFDLVGSSHQVFHVAVVGAAYMHFRCITQAMAYHHGVMNGTCRGDEI